MKNDGHHIKLDGKVCPIYDTRTAWKHLSYEEGAVWNKANYVMIACRTYFTYIWRGES